MAYYGRTHLGAELRTTVELTEGQDGVLGDESPDVTEGRHRLDGSLAECCAEIVELPDELGQTDARVTHDDPLTDQLLV